MVEPGERARAECSGFIAEKTFQSVDPSPMTEEWWKCRVVGANS
jgi:hypothetical protein